MFYQPITQSTDNYVLYNVGKLCNFMLNNTSLTSTIDISSNGNNADIGEVLPNNVLVLDQNSFPYSIIYVKSHVPGSPANFQFWLW
jgi:hypothetical protein